MAGIVVVISTAGSACHGEDNRAQKGPSVTEDVSTKEIQAVEKQDVTLAHAGQEEKGPRFTEAIREDPCALLTLTMIAAVVDIPESEIESKRVQKGMCAYRWKEGEAALMHMRVAENAEVAREKFTGIYSNEVAKRSAEAMTLIQKSLEKKQAKLNASKKGKIKVGEVAAGGKGREFRIEYQYEEVNGIADILMWESTRHTRQVEGKKLVFYANKAHVLLSNLKFSVNFKLKGEPKQHKEETVALVKAMVEHMPFE